MRSKRAGVALLLAAVVALLLAAAVAGCGSGDKDRTGLTKGQQDGLVAQLEAARVSAATRDVEATQTALSAFRRSVARLERSGALDTAAARRLRLGANRVLARVRSESTPAPAPVQTQTQTAPAPTPAPPGGKRNEKKKAGKGKHKGKKK